MTAWLLLLAALPVPAAVPVPPAPPPAAYSTETKADYVIGCMAANGQTRDMLQRCACSIDTIASVLPYDIYERAETVMGMRGTSGEQASLFNETPMLRSTVQQLREAQVEADFRCF